MSHLIFKPNIRCFEKTNLHSLLESTSDVDPWVGTSNLLFYDNTDVYINVVSFLHNLTKSIYYRHPGKPQSSRFCIIPAGAYEKSIRWFVDFFFFVYFFFFFFVNIIVIYSSVCVVCVHFGVCSISIGTADGSRILDWFWYALANTMRLQVITTSVFTRRVQNTRARVLKVSFRRRRQ